MAVAELAEPLAELGFAERLRSGEIAVFDVDPSELFADLWPDLDRADVRINLWQRLNDDGDAHAALAFLVAILGSPLERESAAAAAALWRAMAGIDPKRLSRYARRPRWWFLRKDLELEARDWPLPERLWLPDEGLD
jgi:hypothetical protein